MWGNSKYHYATTELEVDHLPFGAYPVDLLREVGGWDETLVANEDYELDYRLRQAWWPTAARSERGHRMAVPIVRARALSAIRPLWEGEGRRGAAPPHVPVAQARFAPSLVAWLALAAVRAPRHPGQAALMVSPYVGGVAVATRQTRAILENDADWVHLPGAFTAMHVGWGYGFWAGLTRGLSRRCIPNSGDEPSAPGP